MRLLNVVSSSKTNTALPLVFALSFLSSIKTVEAKLGGQEIGGIVFGSVAGIFVLLCLIGRCINYGRNNRDDVGLGNVAQFAPLPRYGAAGIH